LNNTTKKMVLLKINKQAYMYVPIYILNVHKATFSWSILQNFIMIFCFCVNGNSWSNCSLQRATLGIKCTGYKLIYRDVYAMWIGLPCLPPLYIKCLEAFPGIAKGPRLSNPVRTQWGASETPAGPLSMSLIGAANGFSGWIFCCASKEKVKDKRHQKPTRGLLHQL
jgi:hypothetical protein